jgi:hypothetical protein
MVKAVLIYISKEGCGYCTLFDQEWQKIKNSNPDVLYRQYKAPFTKVPEPLRPYERWYPMIVLVPYISYLQSISVGSGNGDNDTVTSNRVIPDGIVFNGLVSRSGGNVTVEYANTNQQKAMESTVNAFVRQNIAQMQDVDGPNNYAPVPTAVPAVAPRPQPSQVVPSNGIRYMSTSGATGRYQNAWA